MEEKASIMSFMQFMGWEPFYTNKRRKKPPKQNTEAPELKYKNTKIKRRIQTARLNTLGLTVKYL